MQETRKSVMCYYDARIDISVYGGLFNPLTLEPFCTYYSFKAFGGLYRLKNQLQCESVEDGVYAAAASNGTENAVL